MSPAIRSSVRNPLWLSLILSFLLAGLVIADSTDPWFSETAESSNGTFKVTLQSVESEFALNEFRIWHLIVIDQQSGEAVTPARVAVGGGMPMHGHGLPSQPQVTEYLGEGRYQIEGLKFNMLGKWVLEFEIITKHAADTVIFEFLLDY